MPIKINLHLLLVQRKMKLRELASAVGITETNLSILKNGHIKAIRMSTLEKVCRHLRCTPGELIELTEENEEEKVDY